MRRVLVSSFAVVACAEPASDPGPEVTSHVTYREIPLSREPQLDVLFVIDNSPAMAAHRDTILANAKPFGAVLQSLRSPDFHIGVVTTDLGTRGANGDSTGPHGDCTLDGDAGALQSRGPIIGTFITDAKQLDGSRVKNYTGDLGDVLALDFDVGATGCSFARPLEAMRRALDNAANNGFLRPHAELAIVFLTPQDDCSFASSTFVAGANDTFGCIANQGELVPVADYAADLVAKKREARKIFVGGAFGPATPVVIEGRTVKPSCTIDQRSAAPGARLQAFLDQFPNHSHATSICRADLTETLSSLPAHDAWDLVPCLDTALADVDPAPGLQPECSVSLFDELDGHPERLIAPCSSVLEACWAVEVDATNCPSGGQRLRFRNPFVDTEAESALAHVECVTE